MFLGIHCIFLKKLFHFEMESDSNVYLKVLKYSHFEMN